MLFSVLQVLFAAIQTVSRSALNIVLYSMLSRVFNTWFGFNTVITFFCSAYCMTKIVGYFQRMWLEARLKNKKPDEKITAEELTWQSPTSMAASADDKKQSVDKFEADWNLLLENDRRNVFSHIVGIPFRSGWLFMATMFAIEYQMNNYDYSYTKSLIRTVGVLIVLISGSSIRYQTLLEREKEKFFHLMTKKRDEIERYIVYSQKTIPVASVCIQTVNLAEKTVLMVQLCQLHSKFDDYVFGIGCYICERLIERARQRANENKNPVCIVWSIPSCKQLWTPGIKANKFKLVYNYKDYSFMPLVNSYVEQYQYLCEEEKEVVPAEPEPDTEQVADEE